MLVTSASVLSDVQRGGWAVPLPMLTSEKGILEGVLKAGISLEPRSVCRRRESQARLPSLLPATGREREKEEEGGTHGFVQEELVSRQVVGAQQAPQHSDGRLKEIHVHVLTERELLLHPGARLRKLCTLKCRAV